MEQVSLAYRTFGEGKILIHTDKLDGYLTGNSANSLSFWRKVLEFTSGKLNFETINIGFVSCGNINYISLLSSISQCVVYNIPFNDFKICDFRKFDCLYFAELPLSTTENINNMISEFVISGGGIIIESPNISNENINILGSIENVFCYSNKPSILTNSFWYEDGLNSYIYDQNVKIPFMSTIRRNDLSNNWYIMMGSTDTKIIKQNDLAFDSQGKIITLSNKGASEFQVGFISIMKKGIVTIK